MKIGVLCFRLSPERQYLNMLNIRCYTTMESGPISVVCYVFYYGFGCLIADETSNINFGLLCHLLAPTSPPALTLGKSSVDLTPPGTWPAWPKWRLQCARGTEQRNRFIRNLTRTRVTLVVITMRTNRKIYMAASVVHARYDADCSGSVCGESDRKSRQRIHWKVRVLAPDACLTLAQRLSKCS